MLPVVVLAMVCGVLLDHDMFAMQETSAGDTLTCITPTSLDKWVKQGKNCLSMAYAKNSYEFLTDAKEYFQKVIDYNGAEEENPDALLEARYYLCICQMALWDDKKAEQAFSTFMKLVDRNTTVYACAEWKLGRLALLHKNYEEAKNYLMKFVYHRPKSMEKKDPSMYWQALGDLAVAEWGRGDEEGLKAPAFWVLLGTQNHATSYLKDLAKEFEFNRQLFSKTKDYLFCYRALAYFHLLQTAHDAFDFMLKLQK